MKNHELDVDDPLRKLGPPISLTLLNAMGEMILDDRDNDEVSVTPMELATHFHGQLEKLFRNKVCDEEADRQNMINSLDLKLRTFGVSGKEVPGHKGFVSIGTVLVKVDGTGQELKLVFRTNPRTIQLFKMK